MKYPNEWKVARGDSPESGLGYPTILTTPSKGMQASPSNIPSEDAQAPVVARYGEVGGCGGNVGLRGGSSCTQMRTAFERWGSTSSWANAPWQPSVSWTTRHKTPSRAGIENSNDFSTCRGYVLSKPMYSGDRWQFLPRVCRTATYARWRIVLVDPGLTRSRFAELSHGFFLQERRAGHSRVPPLDESDGVHHWTSSKSLSLPNSAR